MRGEKSEQTQSLDLSGTRVLLVEDEYYIADDVSRTLIGAGAVVVGPFATVSNAADAIAGETFDCAVIDLNLRGESAVPIAERLLESNKPLAIATGYGSSAVPDQLRDIPRIEKPFNPERLLDVVGRLSAETAA